MKFNKVGNIWIEENDQMIATMESETRETLEIEVSASAAVRRKEEDDYVLHQYSIARCAEYLNNKGDKFLINSSHLADKIGFVPIYIKVAVNG